MTATAAAPSPVPTRDIAVIGTVGLVHSTSHLFQFALPPMFPLLQAEFGVSYAALALVISTFYAASGFGQAFVGIIVDRHGGRQTLAWGTTALSIGVGGMAFATEFWMLFPLAFLAGAGNSVFHPADFSILSSRVSPRLIGRAFAIHAFGGTIGYAAAPVLLSVLGFAFGWRTALILALAYGLSQALIVWQAKDLLGAGPAPGSAIRKESPREIARGFAKLMAMPALLTAFAYLALTSMAGGAVQSFGAATLSLIHSVDYQTATLAVTLFLAAQAVGILIGGFMADATERHELVAGIGLLVAGAAIAAILLPGQSYGFAELCFATAGFAIGVTSASRDLLVKKVSPPGATGRTFGLVYSGFDIGFLIGPFVAGVLIDLGRVDLVPVMVALIYVLTLAVIRAVDGFGRANRAAKAGAPAQ
ncbi:MAG: MFS transporter [Proteobacteria bacterium]|nr:MFS transporter [Pseudomonadota bacterium]